ncbi:MAG: STAS domain-containing protein [Candidatus Krumholzibacteriota bacterium]
MTESIHLIRVNGILGKSEYVCQDLDQSGSRTEVSRYPFDPQAVPTDLNDLLNEGFARGRTDVILDMGNIPWINSKGLGTLVMLYHAVKDQGGMLVLARPVPEVVRLMETTQMDQIFQVFESVNDAGSYLGSLAESGPD